MPTDHNTSYPGGGASNVIMAAASPISRPARSAGNDDSPANEIKNVEYARDLDSCITAAVPDLALEGFLRPPKTP